MSTLREAAQQALGFTLRDFKSLRDFEAARAVLHDALRAALAQPEPRNQCGETCERAKLCAVCARGLDEQEPVAKMHVVFEDNNGALRRTPAGCQAFGANGQPAAVYVGRQRYVPEQERADPAQTPCDMAEDGVCEAIDCCRNSTQEEQEPVAFADRISFDQAMKSGKGHDVWPEAGDYEARTGRKLRVLYTHPPRREWQGLTEEDMEDLLPLYSDPSANTEMLEFAAAIEVKLKERNNG